jgi:hypothetical protein
LPIISSKSLSLYQGRKRENSPQNVMGGVGNFRAARCLSLRALAPENRRKASKSASKPLISGILYSNPFVFRGLQAGLGGVSGPFSTS